MTDAAIPDTPEPVKSGKLPLVLGVILALAGGAGGYFATSTGLILGADSKPEEKSQDVVKGAIPKVSFVPMEPISISLPPSSPYGHLRFRAELEVREQYAKEVESILPRVVDVLNTYLRAVEVADLEAPASLTRLLSTLW